MKGVVFTEFLEMVEATHSPEMVERIIDEAAPASGAAYTAVGTYDHVELIQLVSALSDATGTPVPDLVRAFGRHLFGRFVVAYPRFFQATSTTFEFLASVDRHFHVEVRKLYPDAELPHFETRMLSPDRMEMIYRSQRSFADLADGLIRGCADHFEETLTIERENLQSDGGSAVRFTLERAA
jgi:hypothetical protein